ncbi:MAG: CSLREA domain-containing protein, partial [Gemmatimonadetes bacterium]|nr:CSLREA domain-containing protein [Gemmatimonadota bacterium]
MFGRTTAGVPNDWLRAAPLPTVLLALLASGAPAQTFTVNTTSDADDGACTVVHCSLREAIQEANAVVDGVVAFDIAGPGPHTIRPLGLLPDVVGPLTIDGTTEPGYLGTPLIELDGSLAGAVHGLNVAGPDNVIRGLAVNRFAFAGLYLGTQATRTVVEGCFIGTDVTGTVDRGNGQAGVVIEGSSDHRIGGSTPAERNIISGNTEGVTIVGVLATYNQITGNYIGTDVTGTSAIPNGIGVLLLAPDNWVGGSAPGQGNVIAGNDGNGVTIGASDAQRNVVAGNLIGLRALGDQALPNDVGVFVLNVPNNVIGGTTPGDRNVISGNREGVTLWDAGATMNHVIGNYIGTDAAGTSAVPNDLGVVVYGPSNTVGGFASGTGNLVSGNLREGVTVNGALATNNLVQGNWVGTDASGQSAVANGQAGIFVIDASGTLVGGPQQGAGNLVSGNGGSGILILGSLSDANVVQGNWVGVTLNGDQALPNAADGIYVDGATRTWIGGPGTHEGNLTSGNGAWGVHLWGGTDNLLEGNLIGLTADGAAALGNAEGGVFIQDTPDNFIGSAGQGARNVISGHTGAGIMIVGDPSTGNVIQGNYIGTNISGDAALSNDTGVLLFAPETQIGGSAAGEGNLISGNANMGIDIA